LIIAVRLTDILIARSLSSPKFVAFVAISCRPDTRPAGLQNPLWVYGVLEELTELQDRTVVPGVRRRYLVLKDGMSPIFADTQLGAFGNQGSHACEGSFLLILIVLVVQEDADI
jgi:hypothetical protein